MRSVTAARSSRGEQPPGGQRRPRRGRAAFALAAVASIAFLASACGSVSPSSTSTTTTGGAAAATGVVTRSGSGGQAGNRTAGGGYTVAFAECMRAHGVAKFPDPNGTGNGLDPGNGVDPSSSVYQAALNGPCQPLAPAGWVSSGPVTQGSGGS